MVEDFRSHRWGAERRVSQTRERGPPSAWAETFNILDTFALFDLLDMLDILDILDILDSI